MPDTTLIIFIKAPIRGRVKSRLSTVLGEDAALELYRNFVLDILDTAERSGLPVRICIYPPEAIEAASSWLGPHRRFCPQRGQDLGERMEHAFRQAFSEGITRAVLIGSDLPDLPSATLIDAIDALRANDAVIGPAKDGGYYLIGLKHDEFLPDIFRNIDWGTERVFRQTMNAFHRSKQRVHMLPVWQDVDTIEDIRDLAVRNSGSTTSAVHTISYIGMHDLLNTQRTS